MKEIQEMLLKRPIFHARETEITRPFDAKESTLPETVVRQLASPGLTCYGIGSDVLAFIVETVTKGSRTLETGAGCSTLAFALSGATHIAITPSHDESARILEYAHRHTVEFIIESSDRYLPRCESQGLDIVLLDGKHAFPWLMVDWFYPAEKLRPGGIMLIDDVAMKSVSILADFMRVDPGWGSNRAVAGTPAGQKVRKSGPFPIADDVYAPAARTVSSPVIMNPGIPISRGHRVHVSRSDAAGHTCLWRERPHLC